MKENIVGRTKALHQLALCKNETESTLVIVTGRRRVGKTFLIHNAFDGEFDFKITGDLDTPANVQLNRFRMELERHGVAVDSGPKDWEEAFELLRAYIQKLGQEAKKVFFFDEFPWLENDKSGFLSSFTHFWNDYAAHVDNLLCIICGSSSSWIEEKIIKNKGGLYNRHAKRIHLHPFTLKETELYLNKRGIEWSKYDIACTYMVLGGIPYYLKALDPTLSFTQNIDRLFFEEDAAFADEFVTLMRTLFSSNAAYVRIIRALDKKRMGLTRDEIAKVASLANNGDLTFLLDSLKVSGFVSEFEIRNGRKRTVYRLSDYFSSFYLHFVEGSKGKDHHYFSNAFDTPALHAWRGLAFERVCYDHIDQIKKALGISGVLCECFGYLGHSCEDGAQIDLAIKRRDRVTNLCEIKFAGDEYVLDKDAYLSLQKKKGIYVASTNSKDTIQLTMITSFGVKPSQYGGSIANVVTLDDLFQ